MECYWHKVPHHTTNTPIVVLFHGLTGSYESPYILGTIQELQKAGFSSVVMHFRGCSGVDNLLPRSYHSGDSKDADEYITHLKENYPDSKLFGVGYSLGANMLLKLLGEKANKNYLHAAVAVSAPMRLEICANRMNHGFSRYYQHRLVKDLNMVVDRKYDKHDMQSFLKLARNDIKTIKTFWDFDEVYTAPIHGFSSAKDYYTKCSSNQFLKTIQTNTLIIHSKDDPFMTEEVLPSKDDISGAITLEVYEHGGHVGFISGSFFKPEYWLEKRIANYFASSIL